ncbi:DUF2975 domain-containing protein [Flagellimonas halotolerans]|uniref:DUF2975 domain-containing protein n=1 Tax=Flagellimonas halotolerans TaxID=3112164 RepID=A0ABU6IV91_9FLAO|nr:MULTISPECIES: DUF2975 domain-containing protein [unclassified Allomuricauda]MEC3966990.1 DUF2975 domain-containing protein [Muricauda sp. SYSU M86414]MEC4266853.1 DUF2975 domain-containing protein [Muricauda sp. SYSU M84420]
MKNIKSQITDRGSTLLLKFVVIFLAIAAICLFGFLLYVSITSDSVGIFRPILLGICATEIPFLYALYQAHRLLLFIDRNEAFSNASIKALNKIKSSAFTISLMFTGGMPYIYYVGEVDDAPGVILMGLILVAVPFIAAVFAAVLLKLFRNGLNIKSENDLTV